MVKYLFIVPLSLRHLHCFMIVGEQKPCELEVKKKKSWFIRCEIVGTELVRERQKRLNRKIKQKARGGINK